MPAIPSQHLRRSRKADVHVAEPLVARGGRAVVAFTHRCISEPPNPLSRQLRMLGRKDTGLDEMVFREFFHRAGSGLAQLTTDVGHLRFILSTVDLAAEFGVAIIAGGPDVSDEISHLFITGAAAQGSF